MFRMWFSMHFSVFLIQKKGINDKFDLKEWKKQERYDKRKQRARFWILIDILLFWYS
jgi:hypothetical protein